MLIAIFDEPMDCGSSRYLDLQVGEARHFELEVSSDKGTVVVADLSLKRHA